MKAVSNQNSAVSRAKCLASVVFTDRIVNMPYLPPKLKVGSSSLPGNASVKSGDSSLPGRHQFSLYPALFPAGLLEVFIFDAQIVLVGDFLAVADPGLEVVARVLPGEFTFKAFAERVKRRVRLLGKLDQLCARQGGELVSDLFGGWNGVLHAPIIPHTVRLSTSSGTPFAIFSP